jgi:hypothetical protein
LSNAWRFKTEWNGSDVWVYCLSEPSARTNEIPGPASGAKPTEMPGEVEEAFGYMNGSSRQPSAVMARCDSGKIVEVFNSD